MIVLKYTKTNKASLVSHVDLSRAIMRVFRRANVDVFYTKGFNPHPDMYFSPALSLGANSLCEYLYFNGNATKDQIQLLNQYAMQGVTFVDMWKVENVKLARDITWASYVVHMEGIGKMLSAIDKDFCIDKKDQQVAVWDKIKQFEAIDDNTASCVLACGNKNLRCDKVVQSLKKKFNVDCDYKIVKLDMFIDDVSVDDYLKTKCM